MYFEIFNIPDTIGVVSYNIVINIQLLGHY